MPQALRRWMVLMLLLGGLGVAFADSARPPFPALTGPVVDNAHLLSAPARTALARTLVRYARINGTQLVVVTLPTLNGYPIADFGYQLGRHWGIGQKHKNNGALLIVDQGEHKVRIEVGYGLEGTLTDAVSDQIIRNVIVPEFRAGHYGRGIENGTHAILQVLGTRPAGSAPPAPRHRIVPGLFLLFALYLFFSALRTRGPGLGGGGFLPGLFLGLLSGGFGGGGGPDDSDGFGGGGGSFGGGGASGGW
ncbi:MAG TPA: TPM domain-containing protein [Acidiferrobacteraceae bacterium]|nr:TPM domain-containing protein [Acidiferrobacteraceae bacterium]